MSRLDVESFAQMLMAARCGSYTSGQGHGASDAAMGRYFGATRASYDDRDEYNLGFRVGRFILFAKLPKWQAPMLTHADAADWWERFKASPESRATDPA